MNSGAVNNEKERAPALLFTGLSGLAKTLLDAELLYNSPPFKIDCLIRRPKTYLLSAIQFSR